MAKTTATKKIAAPATRVAKANKPAPKANKVVRAKAEAAAPAATKTADIIKSVQPKEIKMTETAKNVQEKATKFVSEVVEFSKGNVEAVVEAGKVAAKGAQEAGQFAVEASRNNWEATTALFKEAAAVKSPTDFFKLQSDFARARFDFGVAQFSKSTEMFVKLAGEIAQPLQNRYTVAAEKVKSLAL
jgi:hypothetical protein